MKKRMRRHWATMCLVALLMVGCAASAPAPTATPKHGGLGFPTRSTHKVTYRVKGKGTRQATVMFSNATGGTDQHDVRLPWKKTITIKGANMVHLTAQNRTDEGSIQARIMLDGKSECEAESSGAYVVASCVAMLPF